MHTLAAYVPAGLERCFLGQGALQYLVLAALLSDIGEQLCSSCVLCPCNHPYMLTHSPRASDLL